MASHIAPPAEVGDACHASALVLLMLARQHRSNRSAVQVQIEVQTKVDSERLRSTLIEYWLASYAFLHLFMFDLIQAARA